MSAKGEESDIQLVPRFSRVGQERSEGSHSPLDTYYVCYPPGGQPSTPEYELEMGREGEVHVLT